MLLRSTHNSGKRPARLAQKPASWLMGLLLTTVSLNSWAYKVERVCSDIPASASEPAKKICKVVRIPPGKEATPKEEKKEEKKKSGH